MHEIFNHFNTKANQGELYKIVISFKSSVWSDGAPWLPASELQACVRLASEQPVNYIYVFRFVKHCSYMKLCFGLFPRMQEQFLSMVPTEQKCTIV